MFKKLFIIACLIILILTGYIIRIELRENQMNDYMDNQMSFHFVDSLRYYSDDGLESIDNVEYTPSIAISHLKTITEITSAYRSYQLYSDGNQKVYNVLDICTDIYEDETVNYIEGGENQVEKLLRIEHDLKIIVYEIGNNRDISFEELKDIIGTKGQLLELEDVFN